ncbi:MAG: SIS domain-containing protein [Prosthecobacter sp.]
MITHIQSSLFEARDALHSLIANQAALERIAQAAQLLLSAFGSGNRVFSCGNGGSMSDAMHFAEELSGRYRLDRKGLAALAISDVGHISCVANDMGYDRVFSRFLESHARAGDVLLAISTSGKSPNILKAAEMAKALGTRVIALTGKPGSMLGQLADIEICTPGGAFADRVQELHIKVIHILIELVERALVPEHYRQLTSER